MPSRQVQEDDHEIRDFTAARTPKPQRVAASGDGMVSTQHYLATEAGVRMLAQSGNAVDAAVAAAFALAVCEPAASGLGGQTMMLIHSRSPRRTFALDGSSRAPNRTSLEALSRERRRRGYKATTVPSTPAVLGYALHRYGTMSLPEVIAPAIEYAEQGYPVTQLQQKLLSRVQKHMRTSSAGPLFLKNASRVYRIGERFRQPVLAATLRRLAEAGIEDFYTGQIAQMIHEDMARHDGLITEEDLAQIPWPIERRPVSCHFDNMRVVTFPPPGAGRTLVEMLNIFSNVPSKYRHLDSPEGALLMAHVIRQTGRDRRDRPYDPSFYAQIPKKAMLSVDYAKRIARSSLKQVRTAGETTHLSAMDKSGNVVALTQSIERVYGACVATPELGFLYNNYMLAFEDQDMSHPYYLRPNAAPWASVAPTIVLLGRRPWLAIGSPGSRRIVSSILQVLLRLKRRTPYEAVAAPRLHCSLDGTVSLESSRMRSDIPAILQRHGFVIDERDPYSFYLGCVQLVVREDNRFIGVADPRRDGSAGGPR
ncbi:MAG: gamma-glutamyltransferase [Phycisphaerales bacterium]|nr:MAG: gamma-glutamyltransferase [Phycisphaerales bacterium]